MVALRASRLVCSAIALITLRMSPISELACPSRSTAAEVSRAVVTAPVATPAAVEALCAISVIEEVISSVAADMVLTFDDTCSAVAETEPAWAVVSSAAWPSWLATAVSSSEAPASADDVSPTAATASRMEPTAVARAVAIWPISSRPATSTEVVRSRSATRPSADTIRCNGRVIDRATTTEMPISVASPSTRATMIVVLRAPIALSEAVRAAVMWSWTTSRAAVIFSCMALARSVSACSAAPAAGLAGSIDARADNCAVTSVR
jgi:hypothetical protein